jgi:predicted Zn-dependent protease
MPEINSCPHCRRLLPFAVDQHRTVHCPACGGQFRADPLRSIASAETLAALPPPPPLFFPPPEKARARAGDRGVRKAKGRGLPLALGCVGLGTLITFGLFAAFLTALLVDRTPVTTAGRAVVAAVPVRNRPDPRVAPIDAPPRDAEETAKELKALFESLGRTFRNADPARLSAHVNVERMCDELQALQLLPADAQRRQAEFTTEMRRALGVGLANQAPALAWSSFEIRNVKTLPGDEAVVIVRHRTLAGEYLRMRWWVIRFRGVWKIYDLEDLDGGVRLSIQAGMVLGLGLEKIKELRPATDHLSQAVQAFLVREDVDEAEKHLRAIDKVQLPPAIDAVRLCVLGRTQVHRGRFQEALATFERAQVLNPDMPCLDLGKGLALNGLGRWEEARERLQAYRDLLGDDPNVCNAHGYALRGVRRFVEAQAAYRTCLDMNPKHAAAFQGLLLSLAPQDDRADLGPRFAKLDTPRENFDVFVEDCKQNHDANSLEPLARAMQKISPNYAAADYHLGLALLWRGQPEPALAAFQAALAKERNPAHRREVVVGLLQASARCGKAKEAYGAATDAREAFRVLAAELKNAYRINDLRALVLVHGKKHADDALLPFYQGDLLVGEEQYAAANTAFAKGMAKPPDEQTLSLFRYSRVAALYYTGKALTALDSVGPKEETFQELTSLCWQDENFVLLEKLLDVRAKDDPENGEVRRQRMYLAIQKHQLPQAAELFRALSAKEAEENRRNGLRYDFLRRMVEAGAALEAYRAVADPRSAFTTLASNLLAADRPDALRQLMKLHRQKNPDDVWLSYYEAQLALREHAWNEAVRILAAGLDKAPPAARGSFRSSYNLAMFKIGRGLQAYADSDAEAREATFLQLANLLAADRNGKDLEALVEVHGPRADAAAELLAYAARAKVFLNRPAEAGPLLEQACRQQPQEYRRRFYVQTFVLDMAALGRPLQGYRAAPDKTAAFQTLANQLVSQKKSDWLAELLEAHAKTFPEADQLRYYRGELHLLRGNAKEAEKEFAAALALAPPANQWQYRQGLHRARIAAGRTEETYKELGSGRSAFEQLVWLVVQEKNVKELQALLNAHKLAAPDDATTQVWELDLRWLKGDYEGALRLLADNRRGAFALLRYRNKFSDYRVRCLLKLKRSAEALQEAEALVKSRWASPMVVVLVHAAAGDVDEAIAVLDKLPYPRYVVGECYRHAELGPILQSEPFQEFRKKFPEPEEDLDD